MNPINLLLPDGQPSKVWACGECRLTAIDRRRAEQCCSPSPCRVCGEPTEKKRRIGGLFPTAEHDACRMAEGARRDMERLERAEKLESWDGWVWDESDYFESLEDYVEHLECEAEDPANWPEWVYVATVRHPHIDVARVLENVIEAGWEDMDEDDLNGVAELTAAIKAFNAANENVNVYDGDWSRAVRVESGRQPGPDEGKAVGNP